MENVLFEIKANEIELYYLWKGKRITSKPRNGFPWHDHMACLGELQRHGDLSLVEIRMRAIDKFFSKKDESFACIYKHYSEIRNWKVVN